ncbi:hypothetical protein VP01_148g8 [Puccinia sorghi]|uniref:PWWP domain-containing protein n=1 Tax=Puccinia sorghi TaxID=27349 RepID=A0A0L6VJC5_9BASI|nr:hypothetical protein VP01_148g8 [Puccinia sorghi]
MALTATLASLFDDKNAGTLTFHTSCPTATDGTESWRTLPSLSAIMNPSHPFWHANILQTVSADITLVSSGTTLVSSEALVSSDATSQSPIGESQTSPGEQLIIPGEPVVCKTRAREKTYWPARLIGYEGRKVSQNQVAEELYSVHFCDDVKMVVPRSFFFTVFQEEFGEVKIGDLETTKVTFEQMLLKLLLETPKISAILAGSYNEPSVRDRHEEYITGTTERREERMAYGQYSETVISRIMDYLRDHYIFNLVSFLLILFNY